MMNRPNRSSCVSVAALCIAMSMVWLCLLSGCESIPYKNIVSIESKFSGPKSEKGFGIVVREDRDSLDIVTARHVLEQSEATEELRWPTSIEVGWQQQYSDVGWRQQVTKQVITVFHHMSGLQSDSFADTSDLALLRVVRPKEFEWQFCHSEECDWGDGFDYAANRSMWRARRYLAGTVIDMPDSGNTFEAEALGVRRGTSGTPIFSGTAFYGIVTNDVGYSSYGVLSGPIRRFRDKVDITRYGHIIRPDVEQADWIGIGLRGSYSADVLAIVAHPLENRPIALGWGVELGYWKSLTREFVLSAEQIAFHEPIRNSDVMIRNIAWLYSLSARLGALEPTLAFRGVILPYYGIEVGLLQSDVTMSINGAGLSQNDFRVDAPKFSAEIGIHAGCWFQFYEAYGSDLTMKLNYLFKNNLTTSSVPPYVIDGTGQLSLGLTLSINIGRRGFLDALKDLD